MASCTWLLNVFKKCLLPFRDRVGSLLQPIYFSYSELGNPQAVLGVSLERCQNV